MSDDSSLPCSWLSARRNWITALRRHSLKNTKQILSRQLTVLPEAIQDSSLQKSVRSSSGRLCTLPSGLPFGATVYKPYAFPAHVSCLSPTPTSPVSLLTVGVSLGLEGGCFPSRARNVKLIHMLREGQREQDIFGGLPGISSVYLKDNPFQHH